MDFWRGEVDGIAEKARAIEIAATTSRCPPPRTPPRSANRVGEHSADTPREARTASAGIPQTCHSEGARARNPNAHKALRATEESGRAAPALRSARGPRHSARVGTLRRGNQILRPARWCASRASAAPRRPQNHGGLMGKDAAAWCRARMRPSIAGRGDPSVGARRGRHGRDPAGASSGNRGWGRAGGKNTSRRSVCPGGSIPPVRCRRRPTV
jgi:hypothetical protein